MNLIVNQPPPGTAAVDLDILQESALAIAQSTIQNAMDARGLKPSELAAKMGRKRPFVSRMLRSNHNMTIKTFALAIGACGFRVKFGYGPLVWRWTSKETPAPKCSTVLASASTFMRVLAFA